MKMMKRATITVALGLVVGLLVTACNGGSSTASSGVSLAEFQALKAQVATLETTVATLQTNLANVQKVASLRLAVSGGGSSAQAQGVTYATASTTTNCAWTLTGHPSNSNPSSSNQLSAITCNGYNVNVSEAGAGDNGYVLPPLAPMMPVFASQDCAGPIYLISGDVSAYNRGYNGLSAGAAATGFVFVLDPSQRWGIAPSEYNDPSYYWYVPAGESTTTITALSYFSEGCNNQDFGAMTVYPVLQNDASVTGVASAPRPGPVLPAQP